MMLLFLAIFEVTTDIFVELFHIIPCVARKLAFFGLCHVVASSA